uniref:Ig-like domain-containing protein n=1 Tax=Chelonoidis abingdonii TaxID=106734 RepID=A0A8C0H7B6_CHEAB
PELSELRWVSGSVAGNSLTQNPASLPATEGQRVEIRCQYSTSYTSYALDWYQELPGKQPRFLIGRYSYGSDRKSDSLAPRFSSRLDTRAKTFKLTIEGAQRADSAVYFCQATNNVDTDKLIFGKGTTVTVEPKNPESSTPSVFVVKSTKPTPSDGNKLTAACLVKDFYPKNIEVRMSHEKDLVYKSKEGILSSNGKYSMIQVVKVEPNEEMLVLTISGRDRTSFPPTGTIPRAESDPSPRLSHNVPSLLFFPTEPNMEKVNMLSVTVLGLRVLLAKSIAFNMLMTIKLFIF